MVFGKAIKKYGVGIITSEYTIFKKEDKMLVMIHIGNNQTRCMNDSLKDQVFMK